MDEALAAFERGDLTAFLEALEGVPADDLPRLWELCADLPAEASGRWQTALLDRWAEVAPEEGLRMLDSTVENVKVREELRTNLFTAWAGYHPMDAVRAAARLADEDGDTRVKEAVLDVLVRDHPEVVLKESDVMAKTFTNRYEDRVLEATARLAYRDPERALVFWQTRGRHDQEELSRGLVRGWAGRDPVAAAAWVKSWPLGDQDSGLWNIASVVAASDVEAAGHLLSEMERFKRDPKDDGPGKLVRYSWPYGSTGALELILPRLLREDPVAAQDWARHHLPVQADYLLAQHLRSALTTDVYAAMDTLTKLEAPVLAAVLERGGLSVDAQGVLERLDELTAQFPADGQEAGRALLLVTASRDEPEAVVHQASQLPPSDLHQEVLERSFQRWMEQSPAEATGWLNTVPPGESRDGMVWRSVEQAAEIDPATTFAWLMTTAETPQRANLYDDIVAAWARKDAGAARAALETLTLDAKQKKYLLETLQDNSR